MHKLIFLAMVAGLAVPAVLAAPHPPPDYRVAEDAGLQYAQVVSSRPALRLVRVAEPHHECWTEPEQARAPTGGAGLVSMGGVAPSTLGATGAYTGSQPVALEEHCRTVTGYRYEERIEGYDVTYHYQGRIYTTRMPYDPGSRVPVRVKMHPLRY